MYAEYILKNSTICAHTDASHYSLLNQYLPQKIGQTSDKEVATSLQSSHSTSNFSVGEKNVLLKIETCPRVRKFFFERASFIFHSKRFSV